MDLQYCNQCKRDRFESEFAPGPADTAPYQTCRRCREAQTTKRSKKSANAKRARASTLPLDTPHHEPGAESFNTSIRVERMVATHTFNRHNKETPSQKHARRESEVRAKKMRVHQRALAKGEVPPSLTPEEDLNPPTYFQCSICGLNHTMDYLANPKGDEAPLCTRCFLVTTPVEALEDPTTKICSRCSGVRAIEMFQMPNGISRTCSICRTTRHVNRQSISQHSQSLHNSSTLPPPQPDAAAALQNSALPESQWRHIKGFNKALDEIIMEECICCKERWFNMKLDANRICFRCRGKKHRPSGISGAWTLFSDANNADVGIIPSELPDLTDIEEMLISRVHTHLQVRQVKGQQYKYAGHTVHFMKNMSRLYQRLPAHPASLDIILLKPASEGAEHNLRVNKEFEKAYRVRKSRVITWLNHLKANHPDYRDIEIDTEVLDLLPDDGSIHHLLSSRVVTSEMEASGFNLGPMDADVLDEENETSGAQQSDAVVPDLRDESGELDRLRDNFDLLPDRIPSSGNPAPSLGVPMSAPAFDNAPVSEFDKRPIFRMAFPTLFPFGRGDINNPRNHNFSMEEWAIHLLRLKDQRFARHTRFRYVLFNTIMRQRASKEASWAIKQDNEVTLENLRQLLADGEEHQIVGLISRTGRKLRGTRPYWAQKRSDLETMVRNLGCPHLFFTFSAADIQWADLHRHMPGYSDAFLTSPHRHTTATKYLVDNPHIAAEYLKLRFEAFFDNVVKEIFKVNNHWYRFEWQQRGSGHIHGFLWLESAPTPTTVTEENRAQLAAYWSEYVTAINPDSVLPASGINPASLQFKDQKNTKLHLTECINRWQRHTKCRLTYCLRCRRDDNGHETRYCRFHYPKTILESAEVNNDENKNHFKFMAARNDELMVPYNPAITMGWLAHTDMSPCTNAAAVLDYMGKYATKAEQKSESYKEIFRSVTRLVSDESRRPLLSAATKMLNALVVERDWSAQEVSHILLGLDLVSSSCTVTPLDLRPDEHIHLDIEDGQAVQKGKSWLQKYKERMSYRRAQGVTERAVQTVPLLEFCQWWNVTLKTDRDTRESVITVWKKRRSDAKARILNIFPRYSSEGDKNEQEYEDFCRVKVMLHHPFVDPETLKEAPDDLSVRSFRYAFEMCQGDQNHLHIDPYTIVEADGDEVSEHGDAQEREEDPAQEAWMAFAQRRGNEDGTHTVSVTDLGSRPQDRLHNWRQSGDAICQEKGIVLNLENFMRDAKNLPTSITRVNNSPDTLTEAQRVCFDHVVSQHARELQARNIESVPQLLMHVDGSAGTGKSYLIDMISSHLYKMTEEADLRDHGGYVLDPVIRAAPTGVAAFSINGRTIHSLLLLPIRKPYEYLKPTTRMNLETGIWKGRRFLIIDEKSMLGLKQLHQINRRLREIFGGCGEKLFGGLNVLLMGDFCQLPPVGEKPLYNTIPGLSAELGNAQFLYRQFDKTVTLTQIMRQQGDDHTSRLFRTCLQELRDFTISDACYDLLMTRVADRLSIVEQEQFKDAIRLYPLTKMVQNFNISKLRSRKLPVIRIRSNHNNAQAALGSEDDAEGLVTEMLLSKGARLMLTNNILLEFGLVNGTMGTLLDMVWLPNADPLTEMPYMLLFIPDKYPAAGPSLFPYDANRVVLPILPLTRSWISKRTHNNCTRTAFPVVVAYATTVHKSQGLTLDRIVLDLTIPDHSVGLTYVAISRARSLGGLMFDNPFTKARFLSPITETRQLRVADRERRARQGLEALHA